MEMFAPLESRGSILVLRILMPRAFQPTPTAEVVPARDAVAAAAPRFLFSPRHRYRKRLQTVFKRRIERRNAGRRNGVSSWRFGVSNTETPMDLAFLTTMLPGDLADIVVVGPRGARVEHVHRRRRPVGGSGDRCRVPGRKAQSCQFDSNGWERMGTIKIDRVFDH